MALERFIRAPAINAWFFRRQVFERVGAFNISYRFAADIDWFLRFWLAEIRFYPFERVVCHYRKHRGSLTFSSDHFQDASSRIENMRIAESYLTRRELPVEFRRACRRWYLRKAFHLLRMGISSRDFSMVVFALTHGRSIHKFWPVPLLLKMAQAVLRCNHASVR
jgi:hypothetical protein